MSNAAAVREQGAGRPAARGAAGRLTRGARAVLVALTAGIGVFFLARYAALPLLTIRTVQLAGDAPFDREEALRIAALAPVEYWPTVSCAGIQARLEASPLVRRARVERVFPSTLRLVVDRRVPAALVLAETGGRTVALLVDADGTVFKAGAAGAEMDLPVLSGIPAGELRIGTTLPRPFPAVLAGLRTLRDEEPGLAGLVSEVRVTSGPDARGEPDLLVYLATTGVPVRARGPVDAGLVKYSLMVIDLLSRQGILGDILDLDFRSGQVVYRMKEG